MGCSSVILKMGILFQFGTVAVQGFPSLSDFDGGLIEDGHPKINRKGRNKPAGDLGTRACQAYPSAANYFDDPYFDDDNFDLERATRVPWSESVREGQDHIVIAGAGPTG